MYRILLKQDIIPNFHILKVEAPAIARKAQPGQFVVLRVDERGERIPMTIADWDEEEGSITIVFMEVGTTTRKLASLKTGDSIANFVGPLGLPTHIEKLGTVACIGGCYGVASILPIARAMKEAGNRVISVIEARNKNLLFWQDKLESASDQLITITGEDSPAYQEWLPQKIEGLVASGNKPDLVAAIGCTFMMKICSEATKPLGIKTIVHLNPIMVDGTGMCGCCRVSVGGATKFACVDGPEFDGHQVDWDLLLARQGEYLAEEIESLQLWDCQNWVKV
jgi:ferredoxin--NADP+ reductase